MTLKSIKKPTDFCTVSVIIPMRNECGNAEGVINSVRQQSLAVTEIICVDDGSTDGTGELVTKAAEQDSRIRLISVENKPPGWKGKNYACHCGAQAAKGSLLLFLDADTRLAPSGVQALIAQHQTDNCTITVQPYHRMVKFYERFCFFFHFIMSLLSSRVFDEISALYGPVILISASDYYSCGGHERIRKEALDDVALGKSLRKHHLKYKRLLGGKLVSYRMYPNGFKELSAGWQKNIAEGALRSSVGFFVLVFLAVTVSAVLPILFIEAMILRRYVYLLVYGAGFLATIGLYAFHMCKIGNYRLWHCCIYPIYLLFFIGIFLCSFFKKLFRRPTYWKGRDMRE